jgi:predicted nucleic-acid-binding protein
VIGIDTTVLVRYLTQDDPIQSARATKLIEDNLTAREPGFVSVVAMVETAWVLDRVYGLTHGEIATAIELVLRADLLVVESEQQVFTSMVAVREGSGSFADALICELGFKAGCSYTVTFDRKASRVHGFRRL